MAIENPTFEISPSSSTPWEASGWIYESSAACVISGFGTYEEPFEYFTWSEYVSDLDGAIPALFSRGSELYSSFCFGSLIDNFVPSLLVACSDDFEWNTFDPVLYHGAFFGYEQFTWSLFHDVFLYGVICMFDSGTIHYDGFETW